MEADGRDVDSWRAKAIGGACEAVAQGAPLTLEDVQREMQRLARLAAAMQAQAEAERRRLEMDVRADATQAATVAASAADVAAY